jgi:hypothetical protein
MWGDTFRIMTPEAVQTAAFKKDCCSDTRAVFSGHALDFKNSGFQF